MIARRPAHRRESTVNLNLACMVRDLKRAALASDEEAMHGLARNILYLLEVEDGFGYIEVRATLDYDSTRESTDERVHRPFGYLAQAYGMHRGELDAKRAAHFVQTRGVERSMQLYGMHFVLEREPYLTIEVGEGMHYRLQINITELDALVLHERAVPSVRITP